MNLRAALDLATDVIVLYDPSLKYQFINRVGAAFLGRAQDEIQGRTNRELLGETGAAAIEPCVLEVFRTAKPLTVDHRIPLPAETRVYESIYSPVLSDDGTIESVLGVCRDVTETRRKQEEANLTMANSAKLASLGEMAGGIAHEINNPLAVLRFLAGLIRKLGEAETLDRPALSRATGQLDGMVERIARIVHGLRTFSRDGSRDPLRPERMDQIIEDTLSLCQEKFKEHSIAFKLESVASDCFVRCRAVEISQVLLNLFNNAKDAIATQDEKWINVSLRAHGACIEIAVTDSGAGIPPAIRSRIFHPFYTTKEIGHGTGLGLSISKGIAEAHGGTLKLDESSPRTRFVLRLPSA